MTTAQASEARNGAAVSAAAPDAPAKRIYARDDIAPSGRQRSYIARLCLELLGVPFPESRKDAAELIERLKERVDALEAAGTAEPDDIPF